MAVEHVELIQQRSPQHLHMHIKHENGKLNRMEHLT